MLSNLKLSKTDARILGVLQFLIENANAVGGCIAGDSLTGNDGDGIEFVEGVGIAIVFSVLGRALSFASNPLGSLIVSAVYIGPAAATACALAND